MRRVGTRSAEPGLIYLSVTRCMSACSLEQTGGTTRPDGVQRFGKHKIRPPEYMTADRERESNESLLVYHPAQAGSERRRARRSIPKKKRTAKEKHELCLGQLRRRYRDEIRFGKVLEGVLFRAGSRYYRRAP